MTFLNNKKYILKYDTSYTFQNFYFILRFSLALPAYIKSSISVRACITPKISLHSCFRILQTWIFFFFDSPLCFLTTCTSLDYWPINYYFTIARVILHLDMMKSEHISIVSEIRVISSLVWTL